MCVGERGKRERERGCAMESAGCSVIESVVRVRAQATGLPCAVARRFPQPPVRVVVIVA